MTATGEVLEIKMVSKIVPKTLGNPKAGAALKEGETHAVLGRIFGIADGIKQVEIKETGETFFALRGRFQAVASDGATIRSGLLYLPGGIHDSYLGTAKELEEGEEFRFALELRTKPSSSKAGYQYEAIDLMPRQTGDPLDTFAESVNQKRLAAPEPAKDKVAAKK